MVALNRRHDKIRTESDLLNVDTHYERYGCDITLDPILSLLVLPALPAYVNIPAFQHEKPGDQD